MAGEHIGENPSTFTTVEATDVLLVRRSSQATGRKTRAVTVQKVIDALPGGVTIGDVNSAVAAEALIRGNADTTLQNNITSEANTRAAADTALGNAIDTESTARANADLTLQSNINSEATARAAADTTLQTNINAEATTRGNADTTLQTNITTEATARANADTAIDAKFTDANYVPQTVKVELTQSEILTLMSAPVEIAAIPKPGAGKMLKVISVLCDYRFVSEPYDGGITVCVRAKGSGGPTVSTGHMNCIGVLNSYGDRYAQMQPGIQADGDMVFIANEKLEIATESDSFNGDGTLALYITYMIITL